MYKNIGSSCQVVHEVQLAIATFSGDVAPSVATQVRGGSGLSDTLRFVCICFFFKPYLRHAMACVVHLFQSMSNPV